MAVPSIFGNLKLGTKLNAVVLLGMVVLLVTIMIVIFASADSFITRAGRQRVEQEGLVVQSRFEEAGQELLASAKLLASRPGLVEAVARGDAVEIRTLVVAGVAPLGLDYMDLVDKDGAYLMALEEGEMPHPAQEQALLSRALLGIESSGAVIGEDGSEFKLASVVPLRDASGAIVGALLAGCEVDDEFLAESNFSREDVHLALIAEGRVLAQDFPAPELLEEFSTALSEESAIEQVMGGQSLVADDLLYSTAGVPYALAYAPLALHDETHAVIGILVDLGELAVFQRQLTTITIVVFVSITLLVMVLVGVFARRSIVVPIGKLTSATEKMARGDYEQRAEVAAADEIGQLADGFNSMAAQLQRTLESLEQHGVDLQRRSLQMQASAEVIRAATSILDTDQLTRQVVGLIRERFGLYYVGLFLTDETGEWAVLRAGTGTAGQAMLARGHRIKVGEGMVGWCVEHARARVAEEVGADAVHLATPELPDTRSEAALALRSRGRVLGALTVQSEHLGAFDDQRIAVLQTLADQVAIAIDNANLFAESRVALEAERRAYGEMSLAAWAEVLRERDTIGYRCDADATVPLIGSVTVEDDGLPTLDIPIIIHDQVIGTIRARKPEGAGQWTGEETGLMQALAEQLGIALESTRLYRDTQRRAARERLLGETTGRIRETLDMETVLRTAVDQVQQALGLDRIVIRLLAEEDGDSARGRM